MNEHRPMFMKSIYEVRVPEDTSPRKDILHISAQDRDSNSKLIYSLHSSVHPDSLKNFHLDPKSGVLVMTEQLDREKLSVHTLIVMVMLLMFLVMSPSSPLPFENMEDLKYSVSIITVL